MKHYEEIANRVLERRDEYVARQKQKRKTVMKITSVTCALALVALAGFGVWQFGGQSAAPVAEENATKAPTVTTAPTENDGPGIGGDEDEFFCKVHSHEYHAESNVIIDKSAWLEHLGKDYDPEDRNLIAFVEFTGITREEYMKYQGWTEDKLDEIAWDHGPGCPYTKRQFLDAIYGDDSELTAWVFSSDSAWPTAEKWSPFGEEGLVPEEWPPEGYGFGETRPVDEEG